MELMIPLSTKAGKPLYEQIYRYIKKEIRDGNLAPKKQLPSSRELAKSLRVSRSTTQLAYDQLVSEGYLEARPRRGYFVAGLEGILPPVESAGPKGGVPGAGPKGGVSGTCPKGGVPGAGSKGTFGPGATADHTAALSLSTADAAEAAEGWDPAWPPCRVDFSPTGIDLDSFPFSTWRKISRAVLREEEKEMFLKGDAQGDPALREAIRAYLHAARGVNCDASQIVVGAGNEYLLLLLSLLLGRDTGIAMEDPTYPQAWRVFAGMGHTVYPVGTDGAGLKVTELAKAPENVSAAYVMPSHQFPTGAVMPVKRRQELLRWAEQKEGRYLIEDDYDSEFRYRGKPIPALQGLDRSGTVIYMGTFSRAIAPAIRVGYLVLPPALLARYLEQAAFYSSTVSRVDQKILTQFIAGGYFERHLNRMREIYKGKHDALLAALKPLERLFDVEGEFAGLHVLLTYKGDKSEEELVDAAGRAGVRVYGLSGFFIRNGNERRSKTVILGYARLGEQEIREGAALLARAFCE